MNALPGISHRLFAAVLAGHSGTSFFAGARKKSAVVESSSSTSRNQNETNCFKQSSPASPSRRLRAAAGSDGV
jgi:hypothetical protein